MLRSGLHRLIDQGYISVERVERKILVSRRISEEFENGQDYHKLEGQVAALPSDPACLPSREKLEYEAGTVSGRLCD
jgi:putative restriction endonuclease